MATFLNDTFTDTNGVALGSHTGETGATWTKHPASIYASSAAAVQTNRIFASVGGTCFYASGIPASADYEVTGTINIVSAANVDAVVCGRMSTSADTMYQVQIRRNAGTWTGKLFKGVAGVYTQLGSTYTPATPTVGSDHTLKLGMVADQISGYYDGALVIGPVTDSAVTAAGRAGVLFSFAVTSSTGFHTGDITATDIGLGKILRVNQAVSRAAYF